MNLKAVNDHKKRNLPRKQYPRIEDQKAIEDFILLNMALFLMFVGRAVQTLWKAVTFRYE